MYINVIMEEYSKQKKSFEWGKHFVVTQNGLKEIYDVSRIDIPKIFKIKTIEDDRREFGYCRVPYDQEITIVLDEHINAFMESNPEYFI